MSSHGKVTGPTGPPQTRGRSASASGQAAPGGPLVLGPRVGETTSEVGTPSRAGWLSKAGALLGLGSPGSPTTAARTEAVKTDADEGAFARDCRASPSKAARLSPSRAEFKEPVSAYEWKCAKLVLEAGNSGDEAKAESLASDFWGVAPAAPVGEQLIELQRVHAESQRRHEAEIAESQCRHEAEIADLTGQIASRDRGSGSPPAANVQWPQARSSVSPVARAQTLGQASGLSFGLQDKAEQREPPPEKVSQREISRRMERVLTTLSKDQAGRLALLSAELVPVKEAIAADIVPFSLMEEAGDNVLAKGLGLELFPRALYGCLSHGQRAAFLSSEAWSDLDESGEITLESITRFIQTKAVTNHARMDADNNFYKFEVLQKESLAAAVQRYRTLAVDSRKSPTVRHFHARLFDSRNREKSADYVESELLGAKEQDRDSEGEVRFEFLTAIAARHDRNILLDRPAPKITQAQRATQVVAANARANLAALNGTNRDASHIECFRCGKLGHFKSDCLNSAAICGGCGGGHTVAGCHKRN